jgi:response regulator RpfG family c-di-GMP phosphodiesterase
MQKLLVVDDDEQMVGLHSMRLADSYEIVSTQFPEEVLGLALQHKPAAILMDLMMPKFSGFELCQNLHSLSYTSLIPIFVITGESSAKYKEYCEELGAKAFFEKPVDYKKLKLKLQSELEAGRTERRSHVRVRMRVILKLHGASSQAEKIDAMVATENVSAGGFLCACPVQLSVGAVFDVSLVSPSAVHSVGRAKVVRIESPGKSWQRYGFQFLSTTPEWILR